MDQTGHNDKDNPATRKAADRHRTATMMSQMMAAGFGSRPDGLGLVFPESVAGSVGATNAIASLAQHARKRKTVARKSSVASARRTLTTICSPLEPVHSMKPACAASRNNFRTCGRETPKRRASAEIDTGTRSGRGIHHATGQQQAEQDHHAGITVGEQAQRRRAIKHADPGSEVVTQPLDEGAHEIGPVECMKRRGTL